MFRVKQFSWGHKTWIQVNIQVGFPEPLGRSASPWHFGPLWPAPSIPPRDVPSLISQRAKTSAFGGRGLMFRPPASLLGTQGISNLLRPWQVFGILMGVGWEWLGPGLASGTLGIA